MSTGRPVTTRRSPKHGGRDVHTRLSADEHARADHERARLGYRSIGEWMRACIPDWHTCDCGHRGPDVRVVDGSDEWWCVNCRRSG